MTMQIVEAVRTERKKLYILRRKGQFITNREAVLI